MYPQFRKMEEWALSPIIPGMIFSGGDLCQWKVLESILFKTTVTHCQENIAKPVLCLMFLMDP